MKIASQIATKMSGSIGGITGSHNRGGMYLRARAMPVNPNTSQQQSVRAAMDACTTYWSTTLTTAQRNAWDTYAKNVTKTDKLGEARNLTGQNWFCAVNVVRVQAGVAILAAAPAVFNTGTLTPVSITASTPATPSIGITFTNTDSWATAVGGYLFVWVSRPQSPTVNRPTNGYRYAGKVSGAVSAPTSPATMTVPFAFATGQRLWVKTRAMQTDGRLSGAQTTFRDT